MSETTACSDGLHDLCSTRVCTNVSDGWHNARYEPCSCRCHNGTTYAGIPVVADDNMPEGMIAISNRDPGDETGT